MSIKNDDVAVIGMSGRFPGANGVCEFWENICAKKESIRALSDEELRIAGVPEPDIADASYVKASALLDDVDRFDPGFFKISPLEAEMMDPQIRLLLQCAWETLEDAGHARKEAQNIGVFAGSAAWRPAISRTSSMSTNTSRRSRPAHASGQRQGFPHAVHLIQS
jgi:acyl transferase domain-containing protein